MNNLILKGVWTNESVYKTIKKGFNSRKLKGISQNSNGNVFLISGLNKLKIILKPKENDTIFNARMTFPFGWSPLGWALIIPSALLFAAYFIGLVPVIILWIVAYKQEKDFNKEVFDYLNSFETNPDIDISNSSQKLKKLDIEKSDKSEALGQIEKLARLLNEGILTQDEFQAKKEKLLEAI